MRAIWASFPKPDRRCSPWRPAREGALELLGLAPPCTLSRVELPLPPVRTTLTLLPRRGLGAVVLRQAAPGREALGLFEVRPGAPPGIVRLEGGIRSLAFEPSGRYLYAACHDESTLAVIDVREQRVIDRILLAGEPYHVACDPGGRQLWVLCENLGHLALISTSPNHRVTRLVPMEGLAGAQSRVALAPKVAWPSCPEPREGRLSPPGKRGSGTGGRRAARPPRAGAEIGTALWSPLGDEVYVASPASESVLSLAVDRGDQDIKDTDLYLMEQLLRQTDPAGMNSSLSPP